MPRLSLCCFGAFQATLDHTRLTSFHSVKVQALLAYLALEAERTHHREVLATLLWPLDSEMSARNSLRQALYELRKMLGDRDDAPTPFLLVTRQTVQFNQASDYRFDVADFLAHLKRGQWTEAAACYRGELLSGLTCESEPFEEWLRQTHTHLHNLAVDLFYKLTAQKLAEKDFAQARTYAERQLALEPWREEAHRQLMTILTMSGERSAALTQYETCRRVLADELSVEPDAETTALYHQVKAGRLRSNGVPALPLLVGPLERPLMEDAAVRPATAAPPRSNLPPQPTPFVGRQTDLAQIAARLSDPTCRLLTIVGPGGMGKTRLAMQAAQLILDGETTPSNLQPANSQTLIFKHGVCFVALAGVGSPDLLVSTIAAALDFTLYGSGDLKTQLLNYLQTKALLLVLDNCEHLLAGLELTADLLTAAPALKILTTSREPLNLREEWLHPLTGMSFPTVAPANDAMLASYSAVQLFGQRARQMKPNFDLAAEATAVVRICRLVEGMPLGIELASSWLKHFPCDQIANEIERNLDFLATTLRNVPARHRSIRAVFEHSWSLLSATEQQVLQRLAVFRSGFRLEAAQQVAEASFPLLVALAEKSLVQPTPSGRYQMHELLRQFAEAKLQTLPHEWAAMQARHAHYYLLFLQQHEAGLEGPDSAATVRVIEEEIENIRLAWHWALSEKNVDALGQGLHGLHLFFWMKHWYQEGEALFVQTASALAMEKPTGKQGVLLGRCLAIEARMLNLLNVEVGQTRNGEQMEFLCQQSLAILQALNATAEIGLTLAILSGCYASAGKTALGLSIREQALAVLSAQGNTLWLRRTLHDFGHTHFVLGNYDTALDYFQRSNALCETPGDLRTLGDSLDMIGMVHQARGDYNAARRAEQAALEVRTTVGDKRGIAWSLQLLGEIAWHTGDYATAQQRSHESLALFAEIGTLRQGDAALNTLGNVAWSLGDYPEARRYFCLVLARQLAINPLSLTWVEIVALTGLGAVLWKGGQSEKAVELLTHALHQPIGLQETKDRTAALLAELAANLPPEQFAAAQQRAETQELHTFVAGLLAEMPVLSPLL